MPEVIYAVAAALFVARIILLSVGAHRERRRRTIPPYSFRPFVSIIIPARNEETRIAQCLHSIAHSDYPVDRYEIIAVDDRSEDRTGEILLECAATIPNLQIVTLATPRTERNLRGKPGALYAGISASTGEIILMTDADCIVPPDWITVIAAQFGNSDVGLTASFTEIHPNNAFESMQAVEWTLTHSMALAGVGLRQPLGCFGNNLAIRRSVYDYLGGFAGIRFSVTEDLALLQAVFAAGHEIRYVCHKNAAVVTAPCATFGEYIRQHHRWARGGLGLGWRAVIFIILSATLAVSLAVAIYSGHYALLPIIVAIRAIGDTTIIYPSLRALNRRDLYFSSVYSVLFLMALEMLVPILALIPSVRWKGQIFR